MNPYPERIEELHRILAERFGQTDRQATEVVLAAHVTPAISRTRCPWIVIETDYPSRDTDGAWFNLSGGTRATGHPVPKSLAVPRVLYPRESELTLQEWTNQRQDPAAVGVFVESEWRRPVDMGGRGLNMSGAVVSRPSWRMWRNQTYAALLAQCVRLRVTHPKSGIGFNIDRDADLAALRTAARRVLDPEFRPAVRQTEPVPASFLYWCELLQRLAPIQTDWDALTGALVGIGRNIAYLYADGRPADWRAVERVMRDTIPAVTRDILERTNGTRKESNHGLRIAGQKREKFDIHIVREMQRLVGEGVIVARSGRGTVQRQDPFRWHPLRYRTASGEWEELMTYGVQILT